MFHTSNRERPKTIGHGKGGITDKILHGSDSRHPVDPIAKSRTQPPSLQDSVFQALTNHLVRLILVDRSELVGKLLWYSDGQFGIKVNENDSTYIMNCDRVMTLSPIEVDEEAVPFMIESMRQNLLYSEEKNSRLQIVRRRIRERNKRLAAAAKYSAIHS